MMYDSNVENAYVAVIVVVVSEEETSSLLFIMKFWYTTLD